jgi:protein-L-isoaspartate(D-aspartate) O-methyltransferase
MTDHLTPTLAQLRAWYAEELRFAGPVESEALIRAFATVPRERFLGPGPWLSRSDANRGAAYRMTPDADARHVYHDALFALDAARRINNGAPSLWAYALDQMDLTAGEHVLHLGCGTGYYSAVMAEMVGPGGHVTAVEHDTALANRAAEALAAWPQVRAVQADGAQFDGGARDAIVVSAGATHPLPLWLDSLRPSGRLVFPLTSQRLGGYMVKITHRDDPDLLAAAMLCRAWFIPFIGARDADLDQRLAARIEAGLGEQVRSLRRDQHARDGDCWLHGEGFCLSLRDPA